MRRDADVPALSAFDDAALDLRAACKVQLSELGYDVARKSVAETPAENSASGVDSDAGDAG
jgi:hypothetical protein